MEELARRAGDYAVLLYTWMIPHLDDWARMEGSADKVFFRVTPRWAMLGRTPADVEKALQTMEEIGLIVRYEVNGDVFLQVDQESFYEIQSYIPKEKRCEDRSSYPAPPNSEKQRTSPQNSAEQRSAPNSVPSPSPSPSLSLSPSEESNTYALPQPDDTAGFGPVGGNGRARKPFPSQRQEHMFDHFWSLYPRKRSKGDAEKAWVQLRPDDAFFERILAGLMRARDSPDWLKEDGKWVPYPATWLRAKGWDDEFKEVLTDGRSITTPESARKPGKYDDLVIR